MGPFYRKMDIATTYNFSAILICKKDPTWGFFKFKIGEIMEQEIAQSSLGRYL